VGLFGKGFGDLPEALNFLEPLAITGILGVNVPTRSKNVSTHVHEANGEHTDEADASEKGEELAQALRHGSIAPEG